MTKHNGDLETSKRPSARNSLTNGRSKLRITDALSEAATATIGRPLRTVLTGLGTILGVAAVIGTLGIVNTAKHQISSSFNAITSTQVTVSNLGVASIPLHSERSVLAINGVADAGISWKVRDQVAVSSNPNPTLAGQYAQSMALYAATPSGMHVTGAEVLQGRTFDAGNEQRKDRVAVLGVVAAKALNITSTINQPAVYIEGISFSVIGIVDGLARQPGALTGVIIPASTAELLAPLQQAPRSQNSAASSAVNGHGPVLFVRTKLGAAQVVGRQLDYTVAPTHPNDMSVSVPPDPATLRQDVESTAGVLVLLLAGLSILIGMVTIANTTLLAVIARTPEIGLRRAIGARPRHIAATTLLEAGIIGGAGGTIGAAIGVFATTGVALANTWTAVLDPLTLALAPIVGVIAGILAGVYPAIRATRIEPATALQRL